MMRALFVAILFSVHFIGFSQVTQPTFSNKIEDFSLLNVDHSMVSLRDYPKAKGFIIVFSCNHCPFAKLYTERLKQLHEMYAKKDVVLLTINSMDTLVYDEEKFVLMQKKAKKEKYTFPYLYDYTQSVAKMFHATHNPQAFVIWKVQENWVVQYQGALDDNGEHPEMAHSFIQDAVESLLKNEPVSVPLTESFGCKLYFRKE
ncbi:MAG: thioredoxin family protein [Flavobacteriia bacterium]|jgi:peroxiredoxin|nr:thioredoxin family protein [Flavobacteriia bacterium]NBV92422.1 thioredoxin family protein [Flavobacteriia bacterium]